MHTFQPMPIDSLDFNPFTKISEDWFLLTCGNKAQANTLSADCGTLGVLWGKNVAITYVRDSSYTKEFMDQNDFFTISFMDKGYHSVMDYLMTTSGRDEDKITKAGLTLNHFRGIPFIDESKFVVICQKIAAARMTKDMFLDPSIAPKWYPDDDMHTMYVGEILQVLAR